MQLALKKPMVFFDLETTGTNILTDRIVEISIIKLMPNGTESEVTMRINPQMPIPAEATAIHHITDADVADCPTFKQVAQNIANIFLDADVAGFNSNRFDVPMLSEEMFRAGINFGLSTFRPYFTNWNNERCRRHTNFTAARAWMMPIRQTPTRVPHTRCLKPS